MLGDEVGRADEVAALVDPADRVALALPFRQGLGAAPRSRRRSEGHRRICCHAREADAMSDSLPTLWQIEISHFSEKARWALAYKGVEHRRRAPLPGAHIAGRPLADPRRAARPSRSSPSTGATSATRARSSRRSSGASPNRRSIPPTRSSAAAPSSWRSSSTRRSARTSATLAFHEMLKDPDRLRDDRRRGGARPAARRHGAPPTPAPTPACAAESGDSEAAEVDRAKIARRLRPPRGGARRGATTWSARPSASPTWPPPRCSTRSSLPTRALPARRASRRG